MLGVLAHARTPNTGILNNFRVLPCQFYANNHLIYRI